MLAVKTTDISFAERKILIYLGEKNFRGRAVYFSEDAEKAVQQWLEVRNKDSDYLFPSPVNIGRSSISYVAAWSAMRRLLDCADLSGKRCSIFSVIRRLK